ncbi:MAG: MFS transporter [Elusimicrobia bacterium]|nr:MFS transporter [Elusimicrobiota bacterium]
MNGHSRWTLLGNVLLGQFLTWLAARAFAVSLPTIAQALDSSILAMTWALIAYQLAAVGLSIVFGRLGDIYGHRKVCNVGFVTVTLSSLLCSLAQSVPQLVLFRFVEGVGGAMVRSTSRVLALDAFPEREQGKANAYVNTANYSGLFLGPVMGGFLIEYVHWRALFVVLFLMGLAGVVFKPKLEEETSSSEASSNPVSVDYVGSAFLLLMTLLVTLLLDRKVTELFGAGIKALVALALAGSLFAFIRHEGKTANPVVHLPIFKNRFFTLSITSHLIVQLITGLIVFIMPFYLQNVIGMSPSRVGTMFLFHPLMTIPFSWIGGIMTDKMGSKVPAALGLLATLTGVLLGSLLRVDSHWMLPGAMLCLTGIGQGLFFPSNQTAIIGSVPKEFRGLANGMLLTTSQLGLLLGTSFGGFLLSWGFGYFSGNFKTALDVKNGPLFVSALHLNYYAAAALCLFAIAASSLRGRLPARVGGE